MRKLSVNIDSLESQRFARHILGNDCDFYFHQDKHSILSRCKFTSAEHVFIWGRRPPDIEAFKLACKTAKNIFILQHAKNPRREKVPLSYFMQNTKKIVYWLSSMGRLKLSHLKLRKQNKQPKIIIFYFTDTYKKEWQNHLHSKHNVEFVKCAEPDVSSYGSQQDMSVIQTPIKCFYIDEPLTSTLGISEQRELTALQNLQTSVSDEIHVKLHPRSNKDKFINLKQFKVVDKIYKNAEIVAGYRSGLLDFNFDSQKMLRLTKDLTWQSSKTESNKSQQKDYVSQIKEYLRDYDF